MGITVVFGTSVATIFGVFLIPMLFIIVENIGHRGKSFSKVKETEQQ
jgi:HAE1 family hydrophobic/amphiphilic exporter-1